MKILLAVDAIRHPLTGVGRYALELARHLQVLSQPPELRYLRRGQVMDGPPALPAESAPARPTALSWRAKVIRLPFALGAWRAVDCLRSRRALAAWGDHVLHGPGFYLPAFDGRSVVTVHDLSVFRHPQYHPAARVRFLREEIELALRRARHVITVSEFGRRELAEVAGWPRERCTVIPLAAGHEFHPRSHATLAAFLTRTGLVMHGYTLFVGTVEPRKNLSSLLAAYERLPAALRSRWPLVLAGSRGWETTDLHARLERARQQGWMRYLGFVPAADLPLLYAGARLFVFPSIYEGFGLPVIEAMASGVPVLSARGSSLDEVAGDAAQGFEPQDVDALHALLQPALEDEHVRADLRARGLARAASFSWTRCATQTMAVYDRMG